MAPPPPTSRKQPSPLFSTSGTCAWNRPRKVGLSIHLGGPVRHQELTFWFVFCGREYLPRKATIKATNAQPKTCRAFYQPRIKVLTPFPISHKLDLFCEKGLMTTSAACTLELEPARKRGKGGNTRWVIAFVGSTEMPRQLSCSHDQQTKMFTYSAYHFR